MTWTRRSLHRAIRYLFNLQLLETEMLLANITVRDKINIVSTAIEFYSRTRNDDWVKASQKTIASIFKTNVERNFLAHSVQCNAPWLEFFKIVAKGKLGNTVTVHKTLPGI
jgi:hypothetical protein